MRDTWVAKIRAIKKVFILLVKTKEVLSINYGISMSSWKLSWWMRLDLIFARRDLYINSNVSLLTNFSSSRRSTEFKDILSLNISQMIMMTIPIRARIIMSYTIKLGIPYWVWRKANRNWDNNMTNTQYKENYCKTNTRVRITVWVRLFGIEKL